jgi:SulP family sulfate permease
MLTGILFFLLGKSHSLTTGYFKLGTYLKYFPRHVLIGCIGGIGLFLLKTALDVSISKSDSYLHSIFIWDSLKIWLTALLLTLALQLVQKYFKLYSIRNIDIVPIYYCSLLIGTYMVLFIFAFAYYSHGYCAIQSVQINSDTNTTSCLSYTIDSFRKHGWFFDFGTSNQHFWSYWSLFSFKDVRFDAVIGTL